ncbi:MAG: purine-nucleoside phosphorylase [Anaerolineales bacterium]
MLEQTTLSQQGEFLRPDEIAAAAEAIRRRTSVRPSVGMILGSGLGAVADEISPADVIPVAEIPGWPIPTVEGHVGRIVLGRWEGINLLLVQGRAHFYEGHSISRLGLPVRAMYELGVRTLVVTNAAGGVNPDYHPGDLMLILDHINLIGMAGLSPLRGPNLDEYGPRFPDMSQAYDRGLHALARAVARREGIALREGVYVCLAGPAFETPADLRFLRTIGADAVGMSTVPEVVTARHAGIRVLGLSGISNKANLDGSAPTTHEEVLSASGVLAPLLARMVRGVLRGLTAEE